MSGKSRGNTGKTEMETEHRPNACEVMPCGEDAGPRPEATRWYDSYEHWGRVKDERALDLPWGLLIL